MKKSDDDVVLEGKLIRRLNASTYKGKLLLTGTFAFNNYYESGASERSYIELLFYDDIAACVSLKLCKDMGIRVTGKIEQDILEDFPFVKQRLFMLVKTVILLYDNELQQEFSD